jgi:hypothetical protein
LQQWETRLKELAKFVEHSYAQDAVIGPAYELDDFNMNLADGILEPTLSEPQAISTLPDHPPYLDDICTPVSLTSLVTESIPLNTKQRLVVERILGEALRWADYPYDASQRH